MKFVFDADPEDFCPISDIADRRAVTEDAARIKFIAENGRFLFDRASISELTHLIETNGPKYRTIQLQSENPKIFSQGFDTRQFRFATKTLEDWAYGLGLGQKLVTTILHSPARIVAQVDGLCIGAGFEFALACHQIDFGPSARVQFPEFKSGLVTGYGGVYLFTRKFGHQGILSRLLAGDLVNARLLTPIDSPEKIEPDEYSFLQIDQRNVIFELINAPSLEASQTLATRAFLECVKRRSPESFKQ
ncbi:MAG: enoyl-CoA hydratase/isomerase family protein [Deltaproteobacteria bacterium]|nr:enoyl-CoA hydratase/isomerase family protein [Deltaproteobacteria bacterium]